MAGTARRLLRSRRLTLERAGQPLLERRFVRLAPQRRAGDAAAGTSIV
jgi:hypothetical protein